MVSNYETVILLDSKILRWKLKFEVYFPKKKVVYKVSVEPWFGLAICTNPALP